MSVQDFSQVNLEDTFVLAWHSVPGEIVFHVLVNLCQDHPLAAPPSGGDWACYRPAVIAFQAVTAVSGLNPQASVIPTEDADGSLDYGTIDHLSVGPDGEYRICGEFGDATIRARSVRLLVAPAA